MNSTGRRAIKEKIGEIAVPLFQLKLMIQSKGIKIVAFA
jgi:hypothetical protein